MDNKMEYLICPACRCCF